MKIYQTATLNCFLHLDQLEKENNKLEATAQNKPIKGPYKSFITHQ